MGMVVLRANPPDGAQLRIVRNSVRRTILVGRAGVAPSIGDAQLERPHICAPSSLCTRCCRRLCPADACSSAVEQLVHGPAPETETTLPCYPGRQASAGSISCLHRHVLASNCQVPASQCCPHEGDRGLCRVQGSWPNLQIEVPRANHGVRRPASGPQRAKFVLLQPAT